MQFNPYETIGHYGDCTYLWWFPWITFPEKDWKLKALDVGNRWGEVHSEKKQSSSGNTSILYTGLGMLVKKRVCEHPTTHQLLY